MFGRVTGYKWTNLLNRVTDHPTDISQTNFSPTAYTWMLSAIKVTISLSYRSDSMCLRERGDTQRSYSQRLQWVCRPLYKISLKAWNFICRIVDERESGKLSTWPDPTESNRNPSDPKPNVLLKLQIKIGKSSSQTRSIRLGRWVSTRPNPTQLDPCTPLTFSVMSFPL